MGMAGLSRCWRRKTTITGMRMTVETTGKMTSGGVVEDAAGSRRAGCAGGESDCSAGKSGGVRSGEALAGLC